MKLFCPLSGISYSTPQGYGHGQAPHPIFYFPLEHLIAVHLDPFCLGELTPQETHLFGCALLHKLPVIWESPLSLETIPPETWLLYLEKLATICLKHDPRNNEYLPQYKICKRNNSLENLKHFLAALDTAIAELEFSTEPGAFIVESTSHAEQEILRMLRTTLSGAEKKETFPTLMANWACVAGKFPQTYVTVDSTGEKVNLREYWHGIVRKTFAFPDPLRFLSEKVTPGDLDDLIEHCETHLEVGTIHSLALMRKLWEVKDILAEFRSPAPSHSMVIQKNELLTSDFLAGETLGEPEVISTSYPAEKYKNAEPLRRDFPNAAAYIRAKIAWQKGI